MACSIELGISEEYAPNNLTVSVYDCETLKTLVATFPRDTTKFFGGPTSGLKRDDGRQYIIVGDDGYFEYASPDTETTLALPKDLAGEFFEYVKAHVGKPVTEPVTFSATQDPQGAGRRRKNRKTRRRYKK